MLVVHRQFPVARRRVQAGSLTRLLRPTHYRMPNKVPVTPHRALKRPGHVGHPNKIALRLNW